MPQPNHIVRISLPDESTLGEKLQKYFSICVDKLGLVPNVLKSFLGNQTKLSNFIALYNELMLNEKSTGLTKLDREMIAVVVSSANRCYYCLVAHGQAVRELSGDPQLGEMLVMNHRVAVLEDRQRFMLNFAWKLTTNPMEISEQDRQGLRDVGFTDQDIFDISDVTGFFNYTNRLAHGLDMIPNAEYHKKNR